MFSLHYCHGVIALIPQLPLAYARKMCQKHCFVNVISTMHSLFCGLDCSVRTFSDLVSFVLEIKCLSQACWSLLPTWSPEISRVEVFGRAEAWHPYLRNADMMPRAVAEHIISEPLHSETNSRHLTGGELYVRPIRGGGSGPQ